MCHKCYLADVEREYQATLSPTRRWLRRLRNLAEMILACWLAIAGFLVALAGAVAFIAVVLGPFVLLFRWLSH